MGFNFALAVRESTAMTVSQWKHVSNAISQHVMGATSSISATSATRLNVKIVILLRIVTPAINVSVLTAPHGLTARTNLATRETVLIVQRETMES